MNPILRFKVYKEIETVINYAVNETILHRISFHRIVETGDFMNL